MRPVEPIAVEARVLASRPLRGVSPDMSKDGRGAVLVIGGARETPGGVLLAGEAALRAGAGRLRLATVASVAPHLAVTVPEARVTGIAETPDGDLAPDAIGELLASVSDYDAVLVGTGATNPEATGALLHAVVSALPLTTWVVIDAAALAALRANPELIDEAATRAVLVPNPVEMALLLHEDVDAVVDRPRDALASAVSRFACAIALRGPDTWMSAPGEPVYVDRSGHPGLATSGSGDVVVGALTGLLARGNGAIPSMLWAVRAHAEAGARALHGQNATGLLARDVVHELPGAFDALCDEADAPPL